MRFCGGVSLTMNAKPFCGNAIAASREDTWGRNPWPGKCYKLDYGGRRSMPIVNIFSRNVMFVREQGGPLTETSSHYTW